MPALKSPTTAEVSGHMIDITDVKAADITVDTTRGNVIWLNVNGACLVRITGCEKFFCNDKLLTKGKKSRNGKKRKPTS